MSLKPQTDSIDPRASRVVTRPFFVAVSFLTAAGLLAGPLAGWMRIRHVKEPLPLRAPLSTLNAAALAPYRVVQRHTLESGVVEALGAHDYLSWTLEDSGVAADSPLRHASVVVTYDTGGSDLVPHVADVCLLGAGYEPVQPHENLDLKIPSLRGEANAVPVRVCTFGKTAVFQRANVSVVYTFHCNGRFTGTRNGVRLLIHDLTNRYAYFSKVEVSFHGAGRAQTIEGAAKLFDRLLPILAAEHWPDFDAAERRAHDNRERKG